jgi:hypothetical protein
MAMYSFLSRRSTEGGSFFVYFRAFRGCHLLFLPFASFAVNSFGCGYAAL